MALSGAIGVSMGQLSKMIVAEAFTYTIIGGVVGTVLGLFCNKLLFGMLISYRWGDAWTPPLPEVAVILLIVVSSVILAVHMGQSRNYADVPLLIQSAHSNSTFEAGGFRSRPLLSLNS